MPGTSGRSTASASRTLFGTFGGVFTPSILTILGVILYMRSNFVVGQSGIINAIIILLIAKSITTLTALSVSAISTNMHVRGGGAYFMISRVLGAEFGGAIGIALFFAQALSVPFYILGFTEAVVRSLPALSPYFLHIGLAAAVVLIGIAWRGADWAIKAQYVIMGALGISILVFLLGALTSFDMTIFKENLAPGYTTIDTAYHTGPRYSFWLIFAIYFPAVTGILAGVNMSGDLKNPSISIPRGTLFAIGVGFLVYLAAILICGGAFSRSDMIDAPYDTLVDNALFGLGFFVAIGVFAATLSSALGSLLGAPRILQAVSRDDIIPIISPFAKGTAQNDEPRRALILTSIITFAVLIWAGNESEGGALNIVASIITMFFLYTYGMTNLAAFIEAFGLNPSFRPRFRYFHWVTALLGGVGCTATAFLISAPSAFCAVLIIAALLWYLRTRELQSAFGDARRGFVYASVRKNLVRLSRMKEDPRNWRPTILVFTGNPSARETLVRYANWLEAGHGIVYMAHILVGTIHEHATHRQSAMKQLNEFCRKNTIQAFPIVMVADSLEQGVLSVLQAGAIGPICPNMAFFGWSTDPERLKPFTSQLRIASKLGMSLLLLRESGVAVPSKTKRIDIWWRGQKNGNLMVLLAHLMKRNWEWTRTQIRILRLVPHEAGRQPAVDALDSLVQSARMDADVVAIVSEQTFRDTLHEYSADATCVMLGFETPAADNEQTWHDNYGRMLAGLPTTLLISSSGSEDMLA